MLVLSYNFDIIIVELMEYIFGLDFLTVGLILGRSGIWRVYEIGCGFIMFCVKVEIEEKLNGK